EALGRQKPLAVSRHQRRLEAVSLRGDRAKLGKEVGLVGTFDAVVDMDGRPVAVAEAVRHAEERRLADPSGDPDLARLEEPAAPQLVAGREGPRVPDGAGRPLDAGPRARLEPPERARVVADRLDGDPERRLVTGGGDRERVELVADLARSDREHLTLERDVEG